jgi:hypothetical protein
MTCIVVNLKIKSTVAAISLPGSYPTIAVVILHKRICGIENHQAWSWIVYIITLLTAQSGW